MDTGGLVIEKIRDLFSRDLTDPGQEWGWNRIYRNLRVPLRPSNRKFG